MELTHISAYLVIRGTGCLCSVLPFQECLYSKQPWTIEVVSFSGLLRKGKNA